MEVEWCKLCLVSSCLRHGMWAEGCRFVGVQLVGHQGYNMTMIRVRPFQTGYVRSSLYVVRAPGVLPILVLRHLSRWESSGGSC